MTALSRSKRDLTQQTKHRDILIPYPSTISTETDGGGNQNIPISFFL